MNNRKRHYFFKLRPLPFLCAALAAGGIMPAQAVETSFNTTLSYGVSMRMEDPSANLIGSGNGGSGLQITSDDGNLNYEEGDIFSNAFKGVSELQVDGEKHGGFVRVKYWYDMALEDNKVPHGHDNNDWQPNTGLSDKGFNDYARFSGFEFLDAFVYGSYYVNDKPLDIRLGRQVVNWGENIFFFGVNQVNPIDVSAIRRPGFEVKEALLPVAMLYGSMGVSDNVSVEAFYQLEWEKTPIDGCGTYFSTADFVAEGCDRLLIGTPLGDATSKDLFSVARDPNDNEPDDNGQFGLALRYFASDIDAEFGFYYQNLHSRTPVLSAHYSPEAVAAGSRLAGNPAPIYYRVDYPEDIGILGASMSTTVGTVAVGTELSVKQDVPVQINATTVLQGALGAFGVDHDANPETAPLNMCAINPAALGPFGERACDALAAIGTPGSVAQGYDFYDVYQLQVSGVNLINQVMGASSLVLIGELAFIHVDGLPKSSKVPYGRNPVFGPPTAIGGADDNGLVTQDSWGYRARAVWTYPDVFAGVALSPFVGLSHDVKGNSPGPTFGEGRKSFSLGLNGSYQSKYRAGISYTAFDGGDANMIEDRDFLSLNVSMDF